MGKAGEVSATCVTALGLFPGPASQAYDSDVCRESHA